MAISMEAFYPMISYNMPSYHTYADVAKVTSSHQFYVGKEFWLEVERAWRSLPDTRQTGKCVFCS